MPLIFALFSFAFFADDEDEDDEDDGGSGGFALLCPKCPNADDEDKTSFFASLDDLKSHLKETHGVGPEDLAAALLGVATAQQQQEGGAGKSGDKVVRRRCASYLLP